MGENRIRTLPPLVYGKLSGVFHFIIDHIEITDKFSKAEECDISVKILWWGETKPLLVRPKKIEFLDKESKKIFINKEIEHFVKYEVRTKPKLFKSYLSKCDVLELVIFNTTKNEAIGSAFLRDLIHLVYNKQYFDCDIINDSGERIGQLHSQFSFKEVDPIVLDGRKISDFCVKKPGVFPFEKNIGDELKINLSELHSSKEDLLSTYDSGETNRFNQKCNDFGIILKSDSSRNDPIQKSPNRHYNSPVFPKGTSKAENSQVTDMQKILEKENETKNDSPANSNLITANTCISKVLERNGGSVIVKDLATHYKKTVSSSHISKPLTKEKKVVLGSKSKKYCFHDKKKEENTKPRDNDMKSSLKSNSKKTSLSKRKSYIERKPSNTKNGSSEKVIRKDIASKNKLVSKKCHRLSNNILKPIVKYNANIKTFNKVSSEVSKLNELYLSKPKEMTDEHSDLEKVPVKEIVHATSVGKYNKDDEITEIDLNIASAQENLQSDNKTSLSDILSKERFKSESHGERNSESHKRNIKKKLCFDLNDPIEKLYYETFFEKAGTEESNEFEVVELLNLPENKFILEMGSHRKLSCCNSPNSDKRKNINTDGKNKFELTIDGTLKTERNPIRENEITNGNIHENNVSVKSEFPVFNISDKNVSERIPKPDNNFREKPENNHPMPNGCDTGCFRCKYYKKLGELDRIIEALKDFESKMKKEMKFCSSSFIDGCSGLSGNSKDQDIELITRIGHTAKLVNVNESSFDIISDQDAIGLATTESEFSKDDSDFAEFTHYLSKR